MRQAAHDRARLHEREDPVHGREDEREDPEGDVEDEADEPRDDQEQQDEPGDRDEAPEAVRADLLLERQLRPYRAKETSGTAVSPVAEKNSRSRKPNGRARRSHGNDCTPLLKLITVAL